MYSVAYLPKALEDYEKSAVWYSEQSISTAESFIVAIQQRIEGIKTDPTQFRNKYRNYYETSLKKFPFYIVYIIDRKQVLIIGIYHKKRNPKGKYRRP